MTILYYLIGGDNMKNDSKILYKYRSLSNLKRLIEIILDSKLYASRYKDLNDPMEGYYSYTKEIAQYKKEINKLKKESLICSLSKSNNIGMMWIMYADEGKGCCLEVEVGGNTTWKRIEIEYKEEIPKITDSANINIESIFKYKSSIWNYEQEVRYIKESPRKYKFPVIIKKIYLGYAYKASSKEYLFYKALFKDKLGVDVELMSKSDIDFGYMK